MNRNWGNLHPMSKAVYEQTYFLPDENYEGWLARISKTYQNDEAHGLRIKSYIKNRWFHPSTPISSNGGTDRGLPISCMVQHVGDSRKEIFASWYEAAWVGSEGTGLGRYWGDVRAINEPVGKDRGNSSGVIPFMGVDEAISKSVSQGGIRRMSIADYLPVWHPEILEFLDIRSPIGDRSRRAPELHHGVVIDDVFMNAVINDSTYDLRSPKTNQTIQSVSARDLWVKLMSNRSMVSGEPYLLFIDTVNAQRPQEYVLNNMKVVTSQLCSEISLYTAPDYTAVCCLASVNDEYWDEWKVDEKFLPDCVDFLDNVLTDFINRTEHMEGFENSRRSAINERSVALGQMGWHSLLQSKLIPWESPMAKGLNIQIAKHIREAVDAHQATLSKDSLCPLSKKSGTHRRNVHTLGIAPTMSISTLCNLTSSGIEPNLTNAYTKKVKQGSFAVTNKYLAKVIIANSTHYSGCTNPDPDAWITEQWASIKKNNGSVQHLDWMTQDIKDVFKTAFEIDQRWVVEFAGDRQEFIDQAQSVNLFVPGGSSAQYISDLHILAWKSKLKSLYYLRSTAINRASTASNERKTIDIQPDECLSCT